MVKTNDRPVGLLGDAHLDKRSILAHHPRRNAAVTPNCLNFLRRDVCLKCGSITLATVQRADGESFSIGDDYDSTYLQRLQTTKSWFWHLSEQVCPTCNSFADGAML